MIKKFDFQPKYINEFSSALLDGFYLKDGETFNDALARAAEAFCYGDYELAQRIYEAAHKGWFMYASPILSNAPPGSWVKREDGLFDVADWEDKYIWEGERTKAMPISCFALEVPDSISGQMEAVSELSALSVAGGGVGLHNSIRATTDKAPGPIPYMKVMDGVIGYYKQGKCYHPDVEVLTEKGFLKFKDAAGLKVLQVGEDGSSDFVEPIEFVEMDSDGEMIRFYDSKNIDITVTPTHRMFIKDRKRVSHKKVNGKYIDNTKVVSDKYRVVNAEDVKLHRDVVFTNSVGSYMPNQSTLSPYERFLIAFQADGFVVKSACRGVAIAVGFRFKKERKVVRLKEILNACGYEYSVSEHKDGVVSFYVKTVCENKTFDWVDITQIGSAKSKEFLEEVSYWDGACRKVDKRGRYSFSYSTIIKSNSDALQAVAAIGGYKSKVTELVKEGNRQLQYNVHFSEGSEFGGENVNKEVVPYVGKVYCAVVPKGGLIVRSNGHTLVCGNTRRGACAYYMDVDHPDIMEHIKFRIPSGGDSARKADNRVQFHHAVNITDEFIDAVLSNKEFELKCPHTKEVKEVVKARYIWEEILEARALQGEPYLFKICTANRALPQSQKDKGLKIKGSNICIEVALPTNEERTFVCCLSSLNISKFEEWKNTSLVADLTRFLDNVIQFFIDNAPEELNKAVYSAVMERAIGIGTLSWHYYLQSKGIPMEGGGVGSAIHETYKIYKLIKDQAVEESKRLAVERGEPEDMKGTGLRNSALMAIAPNSNNAVILGESPSIEPISGNCYSHSTRAGTFLVKNPHLEKKLKEKYSVLLGIAENKVGDWLEDQWKFILKDNGSVQNLTYMDEVDKLVFKTGPEIDQHWIIEQSDARAQYVCQSQSLNTFFPAGCDRKYFNSVHLKFLKAPYSKSMYYARMERGVNADVAKEIERKAIKDWEPDEQSDCAACSG